MSQLKTEDAAPGPGPLVDEIANEAFAVLGTGEQIATFSSRFAAFDLPVAYDVARGCATCAKRGEKM